MSCLVTKLNGIIDNDSLPKFKELNLIVRRYGQATTLSAAGSSFEADSAFLVASCEYVSQDNPLNITISSNITINSVTNLTSGSSSVSNNVISITTPNTLCNINYNFNTASGIDDTGSIIIHNKFLLHGIAGCSISSPYIYRIFIRNILDYTGLKRLKFLNGILLYQKYFSNLTLNDYIPIKRMAAEEIYQCYTQNTYATYFQPYYIKGDLSDLNFSPTINSTFYIAPNAPFTISNYMNSQLFTCPVRITATLGPMNPVFNNLDFSKANFHSVWFKNLYSDNGVKIKWTATTKAARGRDTIFTLNGVAMEPQDMYNYLLCFSEYSNANNITNEYACIRIYTISDLNISTATTDVKTAINTILSRNVKIMINDTTITALNT